MMQQAEKFMLSAAQFDATHGGCSQTDVLAFQAAFSAALGFI
jgi:hypothetical protein